MQDLSATIERLENHIRAAESADIRTVLDLAVAYVTARRFAEGRALLLQLRSIAPLDPQTEYLLGALYDAVGERALGRQRLESAVSQRPDFVDARLALANNYHAGATPAQIQRARREFREIVALMPGNVDAWIKLGDLSLSAGQFEEAESAYRSATQHRPESSEAWEASGRYWEAVERYDQAMEAFERAASLQPSNERLRTLISRLEEVRLQKRRPLARFPKKVQEFQDFHRIVERYVLPEVASVDLVIDERTVVLTTGSCFAINVALALSALGVQAHHVTQAEDLNNSYANRFLMEWICGEENDYCAVFDEHIGKQQRDVLFATMRESRALIYSLGVAPVFFDRESCKPVLALGDQNLALHGDRVEFRTTRVAENVANLHAIERLLRAYNPNCTFVLTVSPVPLAATQEFGSAIVADCVSKSTLRVAAHEFLRESKGPSFYWPSFELVRWVGGYTSGSFGAEDDSPRHVSEDVVDSIMRAFIERFGSDEVKQRAQGRKQRLTEPAENMPGPTFSGDF